MSEKEPKERYTDEECLTLFAGLFPQGFAGDDVLAEIAPEGWMDSTLHFVFHPTLDQVHWECAQVHRNVRNWQFHSKDGAQEPEPSLDDVRATYEDGPVETEHEVRELVAMCLWDVFSYEHDVVDGDGRLVDIGSWRGAAGFLAEQLNRQTRKPQYDYMDFYMGSFWVSQRSDLTPVYEMIFRRLKERLFDWRYSFPKLQLIEFPSDMPNGARSYQLEKMNAELEEAHRQAIADSKLEPVPAIVLAYRNVYGMWPHGWHHGSSTNATIEFVHLRGAKSQRQNQLPYHQAQSPQYREYSEPIYSQS